MCPSKKRENTSLFILWTIGANWLVLFWIIFSRHYFFLFDDFALIDQAGERSISEIFATPLVGFYRPIVFLFFKILASLFTWKLPTGYAFFLAVIHSLNGILLGLVLRSLKLPQIAFLSASGLFLLSPWSSEAFCWLSAQFDSLALLFFLLSVLVYVWSRRRNSIIALIASAACFLLALLCKENMVIYPVAIYGVETFLSKRWISKRGILYFSPFLAGATVYLFTRASLIGALDGSYGGFPTLLARSNVPRNLLQYFFTLFWISPKSYPAYSILAYLYTAAILLALIFAFIKRRSLAAVVIVMFVVSLIPVLWHSPRPFTTDAGRMLYAPAVFFCVLVGMGLSNLGENKVLRQAPASQWISRLALASCLAGAGASTVYQAKIWKYSCALSQQIVQYVILAAHMERRDLYIRNLPYLFIEGPFIIKSYAFSLYAQHRFNEKLPRIRCDVVHISYRDARLIRYGGPEPSVSDYDKSREKQHEVKLDLPLEELRSKAK
jgi:hypothetical protein